MSMVTLSNDPSLIPPYLNHKEASFMALNRAEPSRIQTLSPIISAKKAKPRGRNKEDDDEIGVFGAEKYFNGAIEGDDTSSLSSSTTTATRSSCHGGHRRCRNEELRTSAALNLEEAKARIQPRTPSSFRSESSWNSRSVLLQSAAVKKPSKTSEKKLINGRRFLSTFGCSCTDKNSVETINTGERSFNKNSAVSSSTDQPICKSSRRHHHHRNIRSPSVNVELRPTRSPYTSSPMFQCKSPEVFGSKVVGKTMSLERRLTMMSWDSPRQEEMVVFKPAAGDSGSDASSDLFEIESLTGKTNPFRSRRASDEHSAGCATPTTGYAPSEASIQWSVVTASAADCSAMSDCDDSVSRAGARAPRARADAYAAAQLQQQRRRASALLGCKSQKAVSVAAGGRAYRLSPGPSPRRPPPGYEPPTMRFEAEQRASVAHISRLASPSPRNNSHLLYIP